MKGGQSEKSGNMRKYFVIFFEIEHPAFRLSEMVHYTFALLNVVDAPGLFTNQYFAY